MANQTPRLVVRKVSNQYLKPAPNADPGMFPYDETDEEQVVTSTGQEVWTSQDYPVVISA